MAAIAEERATLEEIKPGDVRTAEQTEKLETINARIADLDAQVLDLFDLVAIV